jgi:hypothetical protein
MRPTTVLFRFLAALLLPAIPYFAAAQPSGKTTRPRQSSAVAALRAIHDYEASVEAVVSHSLDKDFLEIERASPHKAKLSQAKTVLDKVTDQDLRKDLGILLEEAVNLWVSGIPTAVDPGNKGFARAAARYQSHESVVITEVDTGQLGLLLALLREEARKRASSPH